MHRYMAALCVVGLVGAGAVTAASAATPRPNHQFKGTGGNYWNDGSSWTRHGTATFSFRTSSTGFSPNRYIQNFRATYTNRCNTRTLHIRASDILVRKSGSFSLRFRRAFSNSTAYVKVWGLFPTRGRAKVHYLVDFVSKGQSVHSPSNQGNPGSLGCASLVRGKAR